jgi:hypothetical protein
MCACFFRWLRAQHDIRCRPALVALSATPEGSWAWKRAPEVAAPAQHTMSQPMEGASERRANRLPFSAGGIYSAAGGHPKKTRRAIGGSHRVRDLQYVLESTAPQRASNCLRLRLRLRLRLVLVLRSSLSSRDRLKRWTPRMSLPSICLFGSSAEAAAAGAPAPAAPPCQPPPKVDGSPSSSDPGASDASGTSRRGIAERSARLRRGTFTAGPAHTRAHTHSSVGVISGRGV